MKNHGILVITALLFAGTLAIAGCSSENGGSSLGVLGTGTTGTGIGPSGQVVLIRVGTDNLVQSDPPRYRKIWVAIVTDTAGRAVSGATVTFALRSGTATNPA